MLLVVLYYVFRQVFESKGNTTGMNIADVQLYLDTDSFCWLPSIGVDLGQDLLA